MDKDTTQYNCGIRIWDDVSTTEKSIELEEPPTWMDLLNEFLHLLVGMGYVIPYEKMNDILNTADEQ